MAELKLRCLAPGVAQRMFVGVYPIVPSETPFWAQKGRFTFNPQPLCESEGRPLCTIPQANALV